MQDFSEWMTTLQSEQRRAASSPTSSWAGTDSADSDSDTDCSDDSMSRFDAKRKFMAKDAKRVWARTAPICIPMNARVVRSSSQRESVVESPDLSYHADERLLRAGRYLHVHGEDDVDEDDPAFYGNLAFFRSQYGQQTHSVKKFVDPTSWSQASSSLTSVQGDENDEIFAMEL